MRKHKGQTNIFCDIMGVHSAKSRLCETLPDENSNVFANNKKQLKKHPANHIVYYCFNVIKEHWWTPYIQEWSGNDCLQVEAGGLWAELDCRLDAHTHALRPLWWGEDDQQWY